MYNSFFAEPSTSEGKSFNHSFVMKQLVRISLCALLTLGFGFGVASAQSDADQGSQREGSVLNGDGNNNSHLLLEDDMVVYPNPSTGKVTLSIDESKDRIDEIEVFNTIGMRVQSEMRYYEDRHKVLIDLTGHAKGIYFARVTVRGKQYIHRLVIQ
jgi:hypothetical protein